MSRCERIHPPGPNTTGPGGRRYTSAPRSAECVADLFNEARRLSSASHVTHEDDSLREEGAALLGLHLDVDDVAALETRHRMKTA
jgi:hypothetical protein